MNTKENTMKGGLFVIAAMVIMLSVPMVVGHFALKSSPAITIQASAAHAQ